ncbi:uncharacterized protein RB166_018628 [Leptodactylus fuscus]|uniref:uncharacterized protein LOC142183178 n=1 Tax=Leptodactylus fuscus TaxID=238119 RepID=UPI003F4E9280
MSIITVRNEDGKMSCKTPEGTVVHINIIQPSALDCLQNTFCISQDNKKSGQRTSASTESGSAGFGAAYLSLGLVTILLGVIISLLQPEFYIYASGLHFWVGSTFLVSGALNLVASKSPKIWWIVLAFISLLISFAVSVVGVVITANDFENLDRFVDEQICDKVRNGGGYYYTATEAPRYDYGIDTVLSICKDAIQNYKTLAATLMYGTLLTMIWGLLLSIFSAGSRLKSCYKPQVAPRGKSSSRSGAGVSDLIVNDGEACDPLIGLWGSSVNHMNKGVSLNTCPDGPALRERFVLRPSNSQGPEALRPSQLG